MAIIDRLWLATLTKNKDDAGTMADRLNLTINIDGEDVLDRDFTGIGRVNFLSDAGQAALAGGTYQGTGERLTSPIESNLLTNSSIRLGIRDDDAWGPQQAVVLGRTERRVIVLAMETELERWLSTDSTEGKLTTPLRLVGAGSSSTLIRRVMLLVHTWAGADDGTDSPIELLITAGGGVVLQQQLPDTSQHGFEAGSGNLYVLDVPVPFTRGDVLSNGGIRLRILGTDAWEPKSLFVYGLDTADGRPNEVVHLVSIPDWSLSTLSTDPQEGEPSVDLPVI